MLFDSTMIQNDKANATSAAANPDLLNLQARAIGKKIGQTDDANDVNVFDPKDVVNHRVVAHDAMLDQSHDPSRTTFVTMRRDNGEESIVEVKRG